jgi:hypothetical protein
VLALPAILIQVELVSSIGEERDDVILDACRMSAASDLGRFEGAPGDTGVETVQAEELQHFVSDPAGFFVSSRARLFGSRRGLARRQGASFTGSGSRRVSSLPLGGTRP